MSPTPPGSASPLKFLFAFMGMVALTAVGCTSNAGTSQSGSGTPSASASTAGTLTPSSSPTGTASTPAATAATATPSPGRGNTTDSSSSTCTSDDLEARLATGSGGGAGHLYPILVLENTGSRACTTGGYPGVSFVGGGNGTQLGDVARRDTAVEPQVLTVEPGASVHAELDITQADNYSPDACRPTDADGLRIYPPDQDQALFIATTDYRACSLAGTSLITVRALQAGDGSQQ